MKNTRFLRRALVLVGVTASCALLGVAPASAQPVTNGSLVFGGDPGDYITGGRDYKYAPQNGDRLTVSAGADRRVISVSVDGVQGDWWTLEIAAPKGQELTARTYENATRYPFNGAGPGLSLGGNGRGCNELTGTFTVQNIVFGPHGYVEKLDATFEQHCEGGTAAARGEVHIANAPAPPVLALGTTVAPEGRANPINGKAVVSGTVTCTVAANVTVGGKVTQVKNNVIIRGNYSTSVACKPGSDVPWTASAEPEGTTPFQRGKAEVLARASAQDPNYNVPATKEVTQVVDLKRVQAAA